MAMLRLAAVTLLLLLQATSLLAQRPATPVFDLPTQVPVWGGFLTWGHGKLPLAGSTSTYGVRLLRGSGQHAASVGGALVDGKDLDGSGWSIDGALHRRLREPFPGPYGIGVSARASAAYTSLPLAAEDVTFVDASLALGAGSYGPAPFGSFEFWGMPRAHLRHVTGTSDHTALGPGLSLGISFVRPGSIGLGINIGGDLLVLRETDDAWHGRTSWGVTVQLLR